jgi:hypothetical protein
MKTMKCKILKSQYDRATYLIKCSEFMECVDQDSIAKRKNDPIWECYPPNWFDQSKAETYTRFVLPVFQLINGNAFFISGYHRTVLLSKYLPRCTCPTLLPMALAITRKDGLPIQKGGSLDRASKIALKNIVARKLDINEFVDLPDLPFGPNSE